jgi:hypothetical protein
MIKFFRKIRQNLLMENKTGKYLKYAIGEIVLVVIGILIALSINNWNEERKGKTLANQYANGLARDLKQDTVVLNGYIKFHKETSAGLDTLITLKNKDLNQPSINDSLYILFRTYCFGVAEFKNNENTLTQLKNTGDLVLFNERTKDSILFYEMSSNALKVQGDYYRTAFINSTNISKKMLDYTVFIDTTYFKKGKYTGKPFPKGNYSDNLTRELFNELFFLQRTSEYYLNSYLKVHLENTESLIDLLTKEYEIVENGI